MPTTSYFMEGFLRQSSAAEAKEYLQADPTTSITLTPAAAPAAPQAGQIYFDPGPPPPAPPAPHFYGYNGAAWVQLD